LRNASHSEQPSITVTVQRLDEPLVLPLRGPGSRQCLQVAGRNIVSVFPNKREDEHVHVARRASETPYPPELGREVLDGCGREDVLDLAEQ
jgi:hypothetical protein